MLTEVTILPNQNGKLTKIRKKEISWEIDRMRPYVVKYLIPKNFKVLLLVI